MLVPTLLALLALLGGSGSAPGFSGTAMAQPVNVGDAVTAAYAYHDSGLYERDMRAVMARASGWVRAQAGKYPNPAVILDIDETALSNWPELKANRFAYFRSGRCDGLPEGPCGAEAWERAAKAEAIAPTLDFYRMARRLGVAVFFITGRYENERADTIRNLARAGYAGWSGLVLRPDGSRTASAADYKAAARARIEARGFHILATIGDQPSDLAGGHAERGFLLPNPFYRVP
ncbi:HAD family acid phosphatase [Swaminathania salitolerans]|uniref:Acid phosphatase n=1 Tax=Swaminathania salitolerans TaxID=182838 RepID=A0A511BMJ6_9PROT|nr:HAD family acid phosphatase [Swaminathania salitolerans]GBQ16018.1 acid phosphatase [Swaminathania salitolerans LMG 21291]GEL01571.1 acid phosphatase [Swaminathania salitolerans]